VKKERRPGNQFPAFPVNPMVENSLVWWALWL